MATRKRSTTKPLTFSIAGSSADLPDIVTQIAATPRGTVSTIEVEAQGVTLKALTDRVRRIPRLRGLNALTVRAESSDDGARYTLAVTNTGTKATPWPQRSTKPAKAKTSKPAPKRSTTTRRSTAKT